MKEGCCQGYQTLDEILDPEKENDTENNNTTESSIKKEWPNIDLSKKPPLMSPKEYIEHLER